MNNPLITILMSVYNNELYLEEAIASILTQTYSHFEFLIFNDGSEDGSSSIISSFNDNRIKYFDYNENEGFIPRLNFGIKQAAGKYICRMDPDDVALPHRLQFQVTYLEKHSQIAVCGTMCKAIGDKNDLITRPLENEDIKIFMLNHSPHMHPTVMIRKDVLHESQILYDEKFFPADDYAMWFEISKKFKMSNLPEVLLNYRIHNSQISTVKRIEQRASCNLVRIAQIKYYGFNLAEDEIIAFCESCEPSRNDYSNLDFLTLSNALNKICIQNKYLKIYNQQKLNKQLYKMWSNIFTKVPKYNWLMFYPLVYKRKAFGIGNYKFELLILLKILLCWKTRPLYN